MKYGLLQFRSPVYIRQMFIYLTDFEIKFTFKK